MSNSDDNLFLLKHNSTNQLKIQFNLLPIPDLQFQFQFPRHHPTNIEFDDEFRNSIVQDDELIKDQINDEKEDEDDHDRDQDEESRELQTKKVLSLGEFNATDEDLNNEGFKTPDSPSSKIPSPKQCPPAPRKVLRRRILPPKRKTPESIARRKLQFDLFRDLDSLFFPDFEEDRKIKKARTTTTDI